jgi:xanthine dehydrogenase YagR molybdenum-binding subunit
VVGRPVKLVLTRAQMYANVGYQPQMEQAITLGVDSGGRLTSLKHEVVGLTSVSDDYVDFATEASKGLYATPAMYLRQRVRRAHVNLPNPMRAPIEGPGTWALESAMDELAHRLGMDPLDVRLANYAEVNPADGRPWSSKKLREAYEEGARLFGWRERPREPRRDGDWMVGTGMASCTMGTFRFPSTVRLRLRADGTAVIEAGFHDIGAGTLTVFPQIAADVLGLDPGAISCEMGDTALPQTGPGYGSSSTMGVGGSVLYAAQNVRTKLAGLAGLSPDEVELADGRIRRRGQTDGVPVAELLRQAGVSELVGEGRFALPKDAPFEGDGKGTPYAMRTFGAIFVEVGVDATLGLLRLRRAVGRYSVGRIINPRTARAQMTGTIIWGWGMAAMEASHYEPTFGRWLSKNLAGVTLELKYRGNNHTPGNVFVYAPKQKVLMLMDVVYPGYMPYKNLGITEDVQGYMKAHADVLSYDFTTLVTGHVTRLGTRDDVNTASDFLEDLEASCAGLLASLSFPSYLKSPAARRLAETDGRSRWDLRLLHLR